MSTHELNLALLPPSHNQEGYVMVMNGQLGWLEIYKDWQYIRAVYEQEQYALDTAMKAFLETKGSPPSRQLLEKVRDLAEQLEAKRAVVDAFILSHANAGQAAHTPMLGPDASLDKS